MTMLYSNLCYKGTVLYFTINLFLFFYFRSGKNNNRIVENQRKNTRNSNSSCNRDSYMFAYISLPFHSVNHVIKNM